MSNTSFRLTECTDAGDAIQVLATRYGQLMRWAKLLTRGDIEKAEEIVQELFLYMALVRPDLNSIANLNGYLYTCLRNLYLSSLARASREALHLVNVEDFDSFAFAVSACSSSDRLALQNDLRRICTYTAWRKESSKTASYFILHFFHGYGRQEIAETTKLPIAAIYNKLKSASAEVKVYLEEPKKLRIVGRDAAPVPKLSWTLMSPLDLFQQFRQMILQSRRTPCLPEQELLAHYQSFRPNPISCSLLAHIVSCERCLLAIDRNSQRPTLKDREPLDLFGFSSQDEVDSFSQTQVKLDAMLQSVGQKWPRIYEHRPRTLSIALNGEVIAFHDVRSEQNRLSARIEYSDKPQFAEVFSDQNVRLALLNFASPPPQGAEASVQRVSLSGQRTLELRLIDDGLGLHSEVAYFDPALSTVLAKQEPKEFSLLQESGVQEPSRSHGFLGGLRVTGARWADGLRALIPVSAVAWAVMLTALLGGSAFLLNRYTQPKTGAARILNDAIRLRNTNLSGQTEHQVVRFEEIGSSGEVLQKGVVVLWRDGDGKRYIRRLFDIEGRLIAAEWRHGGDKEVSRREVPSGSATDLRSNPMNEYWDEDLTVQAFAAMDDSAPQVRTSEQGYELTRHGPTRAHLQLISATLTLDHNLQPIRQTMSFRDGGKIHELRLDVEEYERKPSGAVPDAMFDPKNERLSVPRRDRRSSGIRPHDLAGIADVQLAELQIDVLYRLQAIHADTGVPIEVIRTADNRLVVSGTVNTDKMKEEIASQLRNLSGHEGLTLRIVSSREMVAPPGSQSSAPLEAYEVKQPGFAADMRIRSYLQSKGLSGGRLDAAVALFSRDALQHAQRALQHAYALDRLGNSVSAGELRSCRPAARQEWMGMVANHATGLETELRALHSQLAQIMLASVAPEPPKTEGINIDEPVQFALRARNLLGQVRRLNRQAGDLFTSNGQPVSDTNLNASLQTIMDTIPLQEAEDMADFAVRLEGHTTAAQSR
jgi:DNA-directed RNA polymerase specialized sigma24 family protein